MISDRQAKSSKIEEAPKLRLFAILDTSIFYYFACTAIPLIILRRKVGESFSITNLLGAANEAILLIFYFRVLRGLSPKSPKAYLLKIEFAFSARQIVLNSAISMGESYDA